MLTKSDLEQIQKMIANSLGEFFDRVLAPYLDTRFKEVEEDVKDLKEDMGDVQRKLNQNRDEHDRMFVSLDQNEKDHKKIFAKLDSIEERVDGHERRIKKLEKTLQTS